MKRDKGKWLKIGASVKTVQIVKDQAEYSSLGEKQN